MHLSDLIDEVIHIVQDSSLSEKRVENLLNEGYENAAAVISDPLPDLEKTGTVRTSTSLAYVSLPSDYHRNLEMVYDSTQNERIPILNSFQALSIKYPGLADTGNLGHVAISGSRLYYQGIPSTVRTLTLNYFRKPYLRSADRDEMSALPVHLHRRLLVNYACKELFSRIEDGMEGQKVNTLYHDREFQKALADLDAWITPRATEPVCINDTVLDYLE